VSELLEHVHDPRPVLDEAHRVLRPGGMLLGDVPTERGRWGYETIADHGFHARVFTRDTLEALLAELFPVRRLEAVPREGEEHPVYDVPTWYVFECAKEQA
jgi:SAM-dependent methyltransferase